MLWIKEVEMVESVDDLKSFRSIRGTHGPHFEVLDANIASALNRINQNTRFKNKVSLEEMKTQKEDRFLRGRQIAYLIYEYFRVTGVNDSVENYAELFTVGSSKWRYSGIRFEMGWNSIVDDKNPNWWHLGKFVQIKNRRVWETQDRIGIVQYGDSSEESRTWLSQIEDNGEKKFRAEFANEEFWSQKRKLWDKGRGQESGNKTAWTKKVCEIVGNGNPTGSVLKETIAVSDTMRISVQKNDTAESFSEIFYAAEWEKCIENPKSQRQKSQWKNVSIAVQGLPQKNLHQSIPWEMASSRVLVLQVRKWMQVWGKVLLCASPGWRTALQTV